MMLNSIQDIMQTKEEKFYEGKASSKNSTENSNEFELCGWKILLGDLEPSIAETRAANATTTGKDAEPIDG